MKGSEALSPISAEMGYDKFFTAMINILYEMGLLEINERLKPTSSNPFISRCDEVHAVCLNNST